MSWGGGDDGEVLLAAEVGEERFPVRVGRAKPLRHGEWDGPVVLYCI